MQWIENETNYVIQSEAKNLGNINVDVIEILRHYVPLNDTTKKIYVCNR